MTLPIGGGGSGFYDNNDNSSFNNTKSSGGGGGFTNMALYALDTTSGSLHSVWSRISKSVKRKRKKPLKKEQYKNTKNIKIIEELINYFI